MSDGPDFDVALSFAGEDRGYVDSVAHALRDRGVKVFYDLFEEADLWGKDLYAHLSDVYQKRARFTVMFISDAYGRKLWTNHERRLHRRGHSKRLRITSCQPGLIIQRFQVFCLPLGMSRWWGVRPQN